MTIADKVWKGSHRYGCKCDGDHEPGPGRSESRFSDLSVGACHVEEACSTASAEWNAVRASFAQASAIASLSRAASRLSDNMRDLATAPLMGTDQNALAHGLSELAQAIQTKSE